MAKPFLCLPKLSETDSRTFGFPIARSYVHSSDDLRATVDFSHRQGARLLVVRIPADQITLVQETIERGFILTETQIHLSVHLGRSFRLNPPSEIPVREATPEEIPKLVALTAQTFNQSFSHYHADPRLDRDRCDALYADWVRRTFDDMGPQTKIGVVENRGKIVGFGIVQPRTAKVWEATLGGAVAEPGYNPAFVYRAIVVAGMTFARANGAVRCVTATQLANRIVLTTLGRMGWECGDSFYTFHKWFQ